MPDAPAAPEPWPDNALARAIRAHPRVTASVIAVGVLALSSPALRAGVRSFAWMRGIEAPTPTTLPALAEGAALAGEPAGWFVVRARPFADLAEKASHPKGSADTVPTPYMPVGTEVKRRRTVLAVVRIAENPGRPAWKGREERDVEAVAHAGARLPAEVAARFAVADPGTDWEGLPLLVEGAPDRRGATRQVIAGGLGTALGLLALLGAAAGGRAQPGGGGEPSGAPDGPDEGPRAEPAAGPIA